MNLYWADLVLNKGGTGTIGIRKGSIMFELVQSTGRVIFRPLQALVVGKGKMQLDRLLTGLERSGCCLFYSNVRTERLRLEWVGQTDWLFGRGVLVGPSMPSIKDVHGHWIYENLDLNWIPWLWLWQAMMVISPLDVQYDTQTTMFFFRFLKIRLFCAKIYISVQAAKATYHQLSFLCLPMLAVSAGAENVQSWTMRHDKEKSFPNIDFYWNNWKDQNSNMVMMPK